MPFYADLHIHSKYSRATSRNCDFEHLTLWAKRKGITVVGTGDFTHPAWWQEIQDKLVAAEPGLYRLRPELEREVDARLPPSCRRPVRFLLEVEISTIYKKGEKTRKVHHLIYAAELATAGAFRDRLGAIGNIKSDGRPILGLDSRHLLEITLESGDDAYLIPAHIWTPWFSAMGSKSGFDSIADCYGDLADHIFAVETGLSSDPPMNWRVSSLDGYTLVSNSDAHSPPMLGREANVFDTELDYFAMRRALETREGWGGTVEFFPEEGKYHLDGHRACGVRFEPEQTRDHGGRCPSCGKPLTVGVLHRVEALADRPADHRPEAPAPFSSLVPLPEIVSELRGTGPKSKGVQGAVAAITAHLGPELDILEHVPLEDVRRRTDPLVAEAIERLRAGDVNAEGGFDGEYGTIRVFKPDEIVPQLQLTPLFGDDFASPPGLPEPPSAPAPSQSPTAPAPAPSREDVSSDSGTPVHAEDLPLLDRLDADQRAAAEVVHGPLLIVAGPGSGKTRTLTHRLAHLVESGVDPARCLALTFTRRAAAEMRERLEALLGPRAESMVLTTFHGLGLRLLRRFRTEAGLPKTFRIADDSVRRELVAERFGLSMKEAGSALAQLSDDRRRSADDAVESTAADPGVDRILSIGAYRRALEAEGLVDLEDLVARPVELFEGHPELAARVRRSYRHLSVDEYQDIDALQYRLLQALAPRIEEHGEGGAPGGSLCVIGDPDQSIYRFRGADVSFFLRFEADFPGARRFELGRNYRSQRSVVAAAAAVIQPTSLVPGRRFEPAQDNARRLELHAAPSAAAEAEWITHRIEELLGGTSYFSLDSGRVDDRGLVDEISFDDIAVLVRTRAQAPPLLEAFERAGLPVQHRTHARLLDDDAVRLVLQALYVLAEKGALETAAAVTKAMKKVSTAAAAAELDVTAAVESLAPLVARHGELPSFLHALSTGAEIDTWDPRAERISLLTLHASKGLEFPVVFIPGCDDGLLPLTWPGGEVDPGEERRLFFVGLTRAREQLLLTRSKKRMWRGERRETKPSPFLADLPSDLVTKRGGRGPKPRPKVAEQMRLL
ncbi:MAG: UvrD-helicase domain-containing protein [Acidobacteriota bacterium]